MRPFIPTFLRLSIAVLLALSAALAPARAAEPPDNVSEAIDDAERGCKDSNGTPNADAVLKVDDLNGDGGEDWIADYAKLKCEGGINPLCGTAGCALQIYFWDGGAAWDVVFEDLVQSYSIRQERRQAHALCHHLRRAVQQAGRRDLQIYLSAGKGRRGPGGIARSQRLDPCAKLI